MKFKFLFVCLIIFASFSLKGQDLTNDKVWDLLLDDVKIRYYYSFKYDALLPRPKFGKELKKIDGQSIKVKGFFLPVDITGNIYVLSYNPMNTCFFCTGDGLQTIIELNVSPEYLRNFKRLRTDNYFEIEGKLKLNNNNSEHLIYIMDEVKFVKLIK
ncbi:hypothetical protein [Marinifilum caeruleilacunae]|uniref:DUF3299 domain-containing protein n=1 Tax=Marinifilum caeruleilacunae TaxID=2499076 RepID=A0ABX1WUX7_9BACT|nr:hypothetical protein [Marinifilum caeruleilacunae]NOU59920.1 hypothetical protein [Marinifilum caeruleilacunae]